jgi:hypothetical protein
VERANAAIEGFFDLGIGLKVDPYTPAKGGQAKAAKNYDACGFLH